MCNRFTVPPFVRVETISDLLRYRQRTYRWRIGPICDIGPLLSRPGLNSHPAPFGCARLNRYVAVSRAQGGANETALQSRRRTH